MATDADRLKGELRQWGRELQYYDVVKSKTPPTLTENGCTASSGGGPGAFPTYFLSKEK